MTQGNGTKKMEQPKESFWESQGAQVSLKILGIIGVAVLTGYCQAAGVSLFNSTTNKKQLAYEGENVLSFPEKKVSNG
jgi:hypothetical protein